MIRSLRTRQRLLIAAVGLAAGVLGVFGLLARRGVPAVELPAPLVHEAVPILDETERGPEDPPP